MLVINATLFKNQLYKLKNQINKFLPSARNRVILQLFLHVILLLPANLLACHHNGRIFIYRNQGVMLGNNDTQLTFNCSK